MIWTQREKDRRHGDVVANGIGVYPLIGRTTIVQITVVLIANWPICEFQAAWREVVILGGFFRRGHNKLLGTEAKFCIKTTFYI